jgi:hypothetical protein
MDVLVLARVPFLFDSRRLHYILAAESAEGIAST